MTQPQSGRTQQDAGQWNSQPSSTSPSWNRNPASPTTPSSTPGTPGARNTSSRYSNPYASSKNAYWDNSDISEGDAMTSSTSSSLRDTTGKTKLTKTELIQQLSPQGKVIFSSLDEEGQRIALDLASKDSYTDKNLAVKEAQRIVNEGKASNSTSK